MLIRRARERERETKSDDDDDHCRSLFSSNSIDTFIVFFFLQASSLLFLSGDIVSIFSIDYANVITRQSN